MTGFGPPSSQPSGASTRSAGGGTGLPTILAYAAGGLGVLDFIWGFLDWASPGGGDGYSGYFISGGAAVGLGLAAGLWAAARTLEKDGSEPNLGPVALAAAALLVVFGNLVGQPTGIDTKVGMILTLITSLLQVGVLVYAWLLATGKISAPQPKPQGPPQGFGPQGYGGPQGGPQGYGNPQGAPQGYGAPQGPPAGGGYGAPQGPPTGGGYGAPQGPPTGGGYGAPGSYGQQGGQSGPPQGPPPGQNPPPPPQGNPYSPPQGG